MDYLAVFALGIFVGVVVLVVAAVLMQPVSEEERWRDGHSG
jgi:ABC-type lipoprotein release transport system permease subunit